MSRTAHLLPALLVSGAIALAGCSQKTETTTSTTTTVEKPAAPIAAVPPPAGKAWTDIISPTPEGGMRIGNPDAPVKLIEYASFTCPHCKHFEEEGASKLLASYVPSGKISWEFRPMAIHGPIDVVASLLVACRGPQTYFPLGQQLFGYQDDYIKKLEPYLQANGERLQTLPPSEQFKEVAKAGGLYAFFGARGLTSAQADACLADQKALDAFAAAQQQASASGINSTPSFTLNGRLLDDVSNWEKLEPQLKAAIG